MGYSGVVLGLIAKQFVEHESTFSTGLRTADMIRLLPGRTERAVQATLYHMAKIGFIHSPEKEPVSGPEGGRPRHIWKIRDRPAIDNAIKTRLGPAQGVVADMARSFLNAASPLTVKEIRGMLPEMCSMKSCYTACQMLESRGAIVACGMKGQAARWQARDRSVLELFVRAVA